MEAGACTSGDVAICGVVAAPGAVGLGVGFCGCVGDCAGAGVGVCAKRTLVVMAAVVSANANAAALAVAAILLSRKSLRKLIEIVERAARTKIVLRICVTTFSSR